MATVTFVESATTSTGKPYKKVTLDSEVLGKNKFNVFNFHTRYADVVVGRSFASEEFEKDGQYIKLADPDAGIKKPFSRGGGRVDPVAVAMAQEQKRENIEKAQDNKDRGIRLSGAMNHATSLVVAFKKDATLEEAKKEVIRVRDWYLENWDTAESKIDAGEIPF